MSSGKSLPPWNIALYTVIAAYVLLGLLLVPLYRYQINPDGISYISIAQKYLNCDFKHVINGHWAPLFSWLLVPWLAFGIDPLLAVKLLNLCIGAATFIAMDRICRTFALGPRVRQSVYLSLVPVLLYFAYFLITPDLLLTCMLLFYFNAFFGADYVIKKRGVQVGVLGAMCYLAKSYCFPFFSAHFALMNALYYLQCPDPADKKKIIYNSIAGLLVFFCISGVWIGLLSNKYGEFTTTTQTAHNYQGISPEPPEVYYFIPPPNESAISVWEDPYVRIKKISWTPFKSLPAFKHWLTFASRNIIPTVNIIAGFSIASCVLCLCYFLCGLLRPRKLFAEQSFFFPLVSAGLYAGGYCFILVDERYIWIVCLLLMLMGGYLLEKLFRRPFFCSGKKKAAVVLAVFCLSFSILPVNNLLATVNAGREAYEVCRSLQGVVPQGSRIASNGDFYTTLFFCYHLRLKYYGTSESYAPEQIVGAMDAQGIDYFIGWDGAVQLEELAPKELKRLAERSFRGTTFAVLKRVKPNPAASFRDAI